MPKVEFFIAILDNYQNLRPFAVDLEVVDIGFGDFWHGNLRVYLGQQDSAQPEPQLEPESAVEETSVESDPPTEVSTEPEVSESAVAKTRTLRFSIGSTTYTDNGVGRTLEAAPFIADGRTMVSLSVIGEALGATNLNLTDGVVSFTLNGRTITMTIDEALPNNMGTPVIVEGRTFVPLAFIINEMGATARWDGSARAAYIYID